jgi:hypothetical protein
MLQIFTMHGGRRFLVQKSEEKRLFEFRRGEDVRV